MRITVFGGSGRTGRLVVAEAIAAGHQVVATLRRSTALAELVTLGAETRLVDLDGPLADIVAAVSGSDAVVFAAGSAAGETSVLDRKGTLRTLRAARKVGVSRYVSISAIGASTGMSTRSLDDEMKDYYRQKRASGRHIVASGLDWTLIEPGELTDEAGSGKVTVGLDAIPLAAVSRADVAAVVVAVLADRRSFGKAIQLTAGPTPIETALRSILA